MAVITLLTDFGLMDGYVGSMKGVILRISPSVQIVDIAHDISPGDIDAAAFVLAQTHTYFPKGTIHVIVVDPGVGSERRALAVKSPQAFFIAPDNGVLKWIYHYYDDVTVVSLTESHYFLEMSHTFHGRDVFAPVAAHLTTGLSFDKLGQRITDYISGSIPVPQQIDRTLTGEIIHVDHFGNLISNVSHQYVFDKKIESIQIGEIVLDRLSSSYCEKQIGDPLAIFGSHGYIEVAVNKGNAAQHLNLEKGAKISIHCASD